MEYTIEQIKEDLRFKKFLKKKIGIKPATITNYLYALKDFCNLTGKSPTEIHDMHKADLRNHVAEFDMWITDALDDYVHYMIENEFSYDGIRGRVGRIKSFLHAFRLRPTPEIDISKKRIVEDVKFALKVEDIRKAIKYSLPVYQSIFITQAQTGLSISDVLLLDIEDFISAVSKKDEELTIKEAIYRAKKEDNLIGCFDLRRKKTTAEFYTFAGPEVLRNMAELLDSRDEKYLKPDYPIFVKETSHLPVKLGENPLPEDLRLSPEAAKNYVHRMHKKKNIFPQIDVDGQKKNYFRTHKLRKWFSNQVRFKAGFSAEDTKYLMGQKTGDVLERYINPNSYNTLKASYRKALPFLAINDEIVMEENQEAIEKLEMDNKHLQEQMQKREEQHRIEMEEMKARVDNVETDSISVEDIKNLLPYIFKINGTEDLDLSATKSLEELMKNLKSKN
ncbi:hypothetical protein [Methanobacterium spitsbergense]|uniref:Integrase family protein n=1 Tax=Methanobacterium spitsbergense TaxID=2874285 RepID=A0A8T5UN05_9EURY|nr:hypothetical protein [Methanobacterium spitsbergense]MBZ2165208.1 hypothetical protein [Methanobacterium spitsbergense]